MPGTIFIPDGNEEIAADLPWIVEMIARTSRWVHPQTFRQLPVWCPWTARGLPVYDKLWQRRYPNIKRSTNQKSEKVEGNIAASKALIAALGVTKKPLNWTVCHIWSYDDPTFASQSSIVKDRRYFSCIANMVLLPTPLKGFTDALPEIKEMLRTCAYYLYGWVCEHESVRDKADAILKGAIPKAYPISWPAPDRPKVLPLRTALFTPSIMNEIRERKARIKAMLANTSLTYFPKEDVRQVLVSPARKPALNSWPATSRCHSGFCGNSGLSGE